MSVERYHQWKFRLYFPVWRRTTSGIMHKNASSKELFKINVKDSFSHVKDKYLNE